MDAPQHWAAVDYCYQSRLQGENNHDSDRAER